jgi:hypothetical protein
LLRPVFVEEEEARKAEAHLLLTMIFQHGLRAIEACHLDQVDLEAARVWLSA